MCPYFTKSMPITILTSTFCYYGGTTLPKRLLFLSSPWFSLSKYRCKWVPDRRIAKKHFLPHRRGWPPPLWGWISRVRGQNSKIPKTVLVGGPWATKRYHICPHCYYGTSKRGYAIDFTSSSSYISLPTVGSFCFFLLQQLLVGSCFFFFNNS